MTLIDSEAALDNRLDHDRMHRKGFFAAPVSVLCNNPGCGNGWEVPEVHFDPDNPACFYCERCEEDSGEVAE